MSKLNVLIAGATGYIGIQLTKLLLDHSNIKIKYLCGNTSKGKSIKYFDKSINAKNLPKITKFNYTNLKDVKIIFTALPNGEAQDISKNLLPHNVLIDIAADFRLNNPKIYENLKKYLMNLKRDEWSYKWLDDYRNDDDISPYYPKLKLNG